LRVSSRAFLLKAALSLVYWSAMSASRGSSGLGSVSSDERDSSTCLSLSYLFVHHEEKERRRERGREGKRKGGKEERRERGREGKRKGGKEERIDIDIDTSNKGEGEGGREGGRGKGRERERERRRRRNERKVTLEIDKAGLH